MVREGFLTDLSCEGCLTPMCNVPRKMWGGQTCAQVWHTLKEIAEHPNPGRVLPSATATATAGAAASAGAQPASAGAQSASAGAQPAERKRASAFASDSSRKRRKPKRRSEEVGGVASVPLDLDADSDGE